MFTFGGFDGMFHRDLTMINIKPFAVPTPHNDVDTAYLKMVNNPSYHDVEFHLGKSQELVYGHQSLLTS